MRTTHDNPRRWAVAFVALVCAALLGAAVDQQLPGRGTQAQAQAVPLDGRGIDAQTFRRIAEAQTPAVVSIRTEAVRERRRTDLFREDFFERFFGQPGPNLPRRSPDEQILEGTGSGFIIDSSGLILTNNHVVEGAKRIDVGLFAAVPGAGAWRLLEAKIVGQDPLTSSTGS